VDNLQAKLGAKIRQARREANLSQRQLAARLPDISHTAISEWERGVSRTSVDSLLKIAQALQKPLSYFLTDIEEEYLKARSLVELDHSILQTERDIQDPIAREIEALRLLQSAVQARYAGRFQEAAIYAAQSKAHWEALGDQANMASALVALGDIARAQDEWAEAEEHYRHAMSLMESLAPYKDPARARRYAQTLWAYSRVVAHKGQYQEALELLARARETAAGDPFALAVCGRLAGRIYLEQGETSKARQAFTEALVHARRADHPHGEAQCLIGLAQAERNAGHHDNARRHLKEAAEIARQRGFQDVLQEIEKIGQEKLK